jgi:hypothetical protein
VRGLKTAGDWRILRGSKAQKPGRMRLTAISSTACTFANGKWAMAGRTERFGWLHGSRLERDSESGPGERKKLRRANPRSGASGNAHDAGPNVKPSRTSNVAGGVALAGRPEYWIVRLKTLKGTKPHESRGGSQGAPHSFGVHSEGEPKPMRGGSGGNSRITVVTENLKAGRSDYAAQLQRGIVQAIRRYVQRALWKAGNSTRGGYGDGNADESTRSRSTSKPFGADAIRRQALKRKRVEECFKPRL